MSDTVGFISALPTELVAAFRATLEEVLDADLILHVRDISHPQTAEQATDVRAILQSLGVAETAPQIEVWNKLDLVTPEARSALDANLSNRANVYAISALTGEGLPALLDAISTAFEEAKTEAEVSLTFAQGRKHAWLHSEGVVISETQDEEGWQLHLRWTPRQEARFLAM